MGRRHHHSWIFLCMILFVTAVAELPSITVLFARPGAGKSTVAKKALEKIKTLNLPYSKLEI